MRVYTVSWLMHPVVAVTAAVMDWTLTLLHMRQLQQPLIIRPAFRAPVIVLTIAFPAENHAEKSTV